MAATIERARQRVLDAPQSGQRWGELGRVLFAHSLADAARVALTQAARLSPGDAEWPYLHALASSRETATEREVAFALLGRAMTLAGDEPTPQLVKAEWLSGLSRHDEAEALFRDVLARQAGQPRALAGLAHIEYQRGRYAEAASLLQRSLDGAPWVKTSHALMARIQQQLGRRDAALAAMTQERALPASAVWDDPYIDRALEAAVSVVRRIQRASALEARGRIEDADALLADTVRLHPDAESALVALGMLRIQQRNGPGAERVLRDAVRIAPDALGPRYGLGAALALQGRCDEAVVHYRRAIDIQPGFASSHFDLGQCLARLGDLDGAIAALKESLTYRPDFTRAHVELVKVHTARGAHADARRILDEALALFPDQPELLALRADSRETDTRD